jgi:hypothetical protein
MFCISVESTVLEKTIKQLIAQQHKLLGQMKLFMLLLLNGLFFCGLWMAVCNHSWNNIVVPSWHMGQLANACRFG